MGAVLEHNEEAVQKNWEPIASSFLRLSTADLPSYPTAGVQSLLCDTVSDTFRRVSFACVLTLFV